MSQTYPFDEIGRLPLPGDNVAVATRRLEAGTAIHYEDAQLVLDHTVLEGHRFAIAPIATGDLLLSWNLPFGKAIRPIEPGQYVHNEEMLKALSVRSVSLSLPDEPNFEDFRQSYVLDEERFQPGEQVERYAQPGYFEGYQRSAGRGVGTRNFIVLLGVSSRTGGFVRQLEERLTGVADAYPNIDGIVAVEHTEGGHADPHNLEMVLKALAGFVVHPNVGAVLCVDYGVEPVNNRVLGNFLSEHDYPLDGFIHDFLTIEGGFQTTLDRAEELVGSWLEDVNEIKRTDQPLSALKIALQCGGSDAFSGISGNPLAAWVARELIRHGGSANLAETDELIGAEPYALQNVSDVETARHFLESIERFQERVGWHGHSADGNPSGGNKFRGLYNIVLKSIGAAMKRNPDVRLDHVIGYGELMNEPGYYFMDSPGNDLESIAGQVASGCNLIYFVTGNGSITNFPFVPTIKIVTTTRRFELLARDMDVNAGRYLDGTPMDELGQDTFELTRRVASGERSVGEKAGHAQVQLWRDWRQTGEVDLDSILNAPSPGGAPIPLSPAESGENVGLELDYLQVGSEPISDRVGLILPTSLCSGQIGAMIVARLNKEALGQSSEISRFVALAHTEGCGSSGGQSELLYVRSLLGYLQHPLAAHVLLLEHGCEKTHNDYFRHEMKQRGLDPERFGWASIQLDGGIEAVSEKVRRWFETALANERAPKHVSAGAEAVRIGLMSAGPVSNQVGKTMGQFGRAIVAGGGSVVVPENSALLSHFPFLSALNPANPILPTLPYGGSLMGAQGSGFHVMESPTGHWDETLTGLAATGVETVLVHVGEHPLAGHPLVPVLQMSAEERVEQRYGSDLDLLLEADPENWPQQMSEVVSAVLSRKLKPKADQVGNVKLQFTRGLLGVSM